ncbi:DnaJ-domain-containing protein [Lentithecium fluviatile CBS 122367]|uniref:DnaJ-domain-containing protein n=1 Tax=Lentithecium fluviatile CBS 122367 TaxID=1168545 RepID=A0A6G1J0P6_9PLEO|nr:DnaJ-domain-containing protein [Lentithecium fluviatile CBS 122367]
MGPSTTAPDYYAILGLAQAATHDEIKAAYRRLALKHHPDRDGKSAHATQKMQGINAAWETLGDSRMRAIYDSTYHPQSCGATSNYPTASHPTATPQSSWQWPLNGNRTERQAWEHFETHQEHNIKAYQNKIRDLQAEISRLNATITRNKSILEKNAVSSWNTPGMSEWGREEMRRHTLECEAAIREKKESLKEFSALVQELWEKLAQARVREDERLKNERNEAWRNAAREQAAQEGRDRRECQRQQERERGRVDRRPREGKPSRKEEKHSGAQHNACRHDSWVEVSYLCANCPQRKEQNVIRCLGCSTTVCTNCGTDLNLQRYF